MTFVVGWASARWSTTPTCCKPGGTTPHPSARRAVRWPWSARRPPEEVRQVVLVAREHRTPLVTQGARTGLSGGANAVDGCLLLSTERMNRILEVDVADQAAVVQPGVVSAQLSRAVAEQGLFYPPDPSSWEESTIG